MGGNGKGQVLEGDVLISREGLYHLLIAGMQAHTLTTYSPNWTQFHEDTERAVIEAHTALNVPYTSRMPGRVIIDGKTYVNSL